MSEPHPRLPNLISVCERPVVAQFADSDQPRLLRDYKGIRKHIGDHISLCVDNVYRWMLAGGFVFKEEIAQDLPCLTLPWSNFIGFYSLQNNGKTPWQRHIKEAGFVGHSIDSREIEDWEVETFVGGKYKDSGYRWVNVLQLLYAINDHGKRTVCLSGICCAFVLANDGSIINARFLSSPEYTQHFDVMHREFWLAFYPVGLGLCFANYPKITKRDCSAEMNPSEKWVRQTRKPRLRYYVLDISGLATATAGTVGGNHIDRALHLCRGNFATYTADAPLFGKYIGRFWRPMHVRGDQKNGVVAKDYSVTP